MDNNFVLFNRNTSWTEYGIRFTSVRAEHSDPTPIGVIIDDGEKKYYVTGDTLYNEEIFADIPGDIYALFLPVNGGGNIIFINSNTAYRAIPDRIAYSASKCAQLGMMRAMALDLGKYNIRVNAVLPGMIRTDRWEKNPEFYKTVPSRFTPLGDVAVGEDIADAAWYFATYAKNTTGAELVVDGGNTIQLYPVTGNAE